MVRARSHLVMHLICFGVLTWCCHGGMQVEKRLPVFRTELVEGTEKAILNQVGAWFAVMQSSTPSDDVGKKEKRQLLEKGFA